MRAYNAGDVFTVVDLLSIVAGSDIKNILSATTSAVSSAQSGDENATGERAVELAAYVLNVLYKGCREKLIAWFASLYNMGVTQFLEQPPELVIETIEELATRKESSDFFSRASAAFKKINGLRATTKSE
jgi:hypothetical protein